MNAKEQTRKWNHLGVDKAMFTKETQENLEENQFLKNREEKCLLLYRRWIELEDDDVGLTFCKVFTAEFHGKFWQVAAP